ncbi:MAG: FkbM family methyltransferase [Rhodobacter sp.]|nr:FkbM family methyltransferase [Rhodobacter sp.]
MPWALDDFLTAFRSIEPFQSRLSPRFWPGPLRLRLQPPGLGPVAIRFDAASAAWVRARTKTGLGVHEPGLVKSLIALRRLHGPFEGHDFYDVGSLHGYVGLLAGRILQTRRVVGFEMNPQAARLAGTNAALNATAGQEITVLHAGVSNEVARAVPCLYKDFALAVRPDPATARRLRQQGYQAVDIDLLTLDDVSEKRNLFPKVIKIDVEGSQMSILRGAGKILRESAPVLLIEADGPNASNSDGTPMADLCSHLIRNYDYRIAATNHRDWEAPLVVVTDAAIASGKLKLERNQLFVCLPPR